MLVTKMRTVVIARRAGKIVRDLRKRRVLWIMVSTLLVLAIMLTGILVASIVSDTAHHQAATAAPAAHGSGNTGHTSTVAPRIRRHKTTPRAGLTAPKRNSIPRPRHGSMPVRPTRNSTHSLSRVVVHAGDTLWKIAQQHGTTWQHIWNLNRDKVANPNLIYSGQILRT